MAAISLTNSRALDRSAGCCELLQPTGREVGGSVAPTTPAGETIYLHCLIPITAHLTVASRSYGTVINQHLIN